MHDHKEKGMKQPGGLFIPAGIFLGMGVGFWLNELVAGLFIGMGAGFLLFGFSLFFKNN